MIHGYVVVLPPEEVGHGLSGPLSPIRYAGKNIVYRGVDRDPWWNLDEKFYAGQLHDELKKLRSTIKVDAAAIFSPGVCGDLASAEKGARVCEERGVADEIVWISNILDDTSSGGALLGYDCYVDGFGSLVRLGLFTNAAIFPEFVGKLNAFGLFSYVDDLSSYVDAYINRSSEANLELVERYRLSPSCSFQVRSAS